MEATGGLTVVADARALMGDAESLTTATNLTTSGIMPLRCSGRYINLSFRLAAGAEWTFVQGFEPAVEAGGLR